jgi:hypothetical protein
MRDRWREVAVSEPAVLESVPLELVDSETLRTGFLHLAYWPTRGE